MSLIERFFVRLYLRAIRRSLREATNPSVKRTLQILIDSIENGRPANETIGAINEVVNPKAAFSKCAALMTETAFVKGESFPSGSTERWFLRVDLPMSLVGFAGFTAEDYTSTSVTAIECGGRQAWRGSALPLYAVNEVLKAVPFPVEPGQVLTVWLSEPERTEPRERFAAIFELIPF